MVLTDIEKFDKFHRTLFLAKIKNTKLDYANEFNDNEHLKGTRFRDDDRILRFILGAIYSECNLDYAAANSKFLSLNSTEAEPYIKEAVLDAASCDYYYTYEKEY